MKKLKLLITSPYGPELLNGVSIYIKKLALSLSKQNIIVDIFTFKKGIKKQMSINYKGFKIIYHPIKHNNFLFNQYYYIIYTGIFLFKYGHRYNLIHIHTISTALTLISILFAKILKKSKILTIHGNRKIFSEQVLIKGIIEKFFRWFLGKIVIELSDAIISVSKPVLSDIYQYFKCKKCKNLFYIPNGIILKNNEISINLIQRKYITFIGCLSYYKGLDVFLELTEFLYESNPELRFLIIGKPDSKNQKLYKFFLNKKRKLNIKHIKETKFINKYFLKSKIYILSSRSEGMSTTLLEAMKYLTPVMATDIKANSNIIKDGHNGFLFNPNNLKAAAKKIEDLLKDNMLYEKIIKNARKFVEENHNWENIVKKNILVYKKILKENKFY